MSDDGAEALTAIAFVGSVFSPYYAAARRRGPADPAEHCALNVAVYGRSGKHWSMTERGRRALHCSPSRLGIGPSALDWQDGTLTLEFDEVTVPWPRRLRGRVQLRAGASFDHAVSLDPAGLHHWAPLAPAARVEVDLEAPRRRWAGHGYLDTNWGSAPLEQGFAAWHWSRATLADGSTVVLYDLAPRGAPARAFGLRCGRDGTVTDLDPPPAHALPGTGWGIARRTRGTPGAARVLRTLEDTPFYARSLLEARLLDEELTAVHESLSLDRFSTRWVQALLPFRMPRRAG